MSQDDVVIVSAARTPIGALGGGLSELSAHTLGAAVIAEVSRRASVDPSEITEIILGQVLATAQGQNPARKAAVLAGVPYASTAFLINQVCGSALRAVTLGAQQIRAGDAEIIVAGGQESMSMAPHALHLRKGVKLGDASFKDTMILDGLWDAFNDYHMGITAENVAKHAGISREDQDAFAFASQQKTKKAYEAGKFSDEITPVVIKSKKGDKTISTDEHPRFETTLESLAGLRPAFTPEGTVTAGNASGINDGAAAVLLMSQKNAQKRGLTPLARIASWATCGVDPAIMGTGPIPASRRALEKAGWNAKDLDLIEANEAFAAQALAVNRELGWDPDRVNVNGGAVALGHPIGASGARILVTLLHEMNRRNARKGLATLCIGGGMGIAACLER